MLASDTKSAVLLIWRYFLGLGGVLWRPRNPRRLSSARRDLTRVLTQPRRSTAEIPSPRKGRDLPPVTRPGCAPAAAADELPRGLAERPPWRPSGAPAARSGRPAADAG